MLFRSTKRVSQSASKALTRYGSENVAKEQREVVALEAAAVVQASNLAGLLVQGLLLHHAGAHPTELLHAILTYLEVAVVLLEESSEEHVRRLDPPLLHHHQDPHQDEGRTIYRGVGLDLHLVSRDVSLRARGMGL